MCTNSCARDPRRSVGSTCPPRSPSAVGEARWTSSNQLPSQLKERRLTFGHLCSRLFVETKDREVSLHRWHIDTNSCLNKSKDSLRAIPRKTRSRSWTRQPRHHCIPSSAQAPWFLARSLASLARANDLCFGLELSKISSISSKASCFVSTTKV